MATQITGFTSEQVSFLTAHIQCILDESLNKYFRSPQQPLQQPITKQKKKQKKNQKTRKQYKRRILQSIAESTQCRITKNPRNSGFLSTILHPASKQFYGGDTLPDLLGNAVPRLLAYIRFGKHLEASGEG